MGHVTFTELRQHMARYFDRITQDRKPLVVTRPDGKDNVVVMSEAEFTGWQETVHVLSSPKNAARLLKAVRQSKAGESRERTLLAPGKTGD